jgi:hypothetical protein
MQNAQANTTPSRLSSSCPPITNNPHNSHTIAHSPSHYLQKHRQTHNTNQSPNPHSHRLSSSPLLRLNRRALRPIRAHRSVRRSISLRRTVRKPVGSYRTLQPCRLNKTLQIKHKAAHRAAVGLREALGHDKGPARGRWERVGEEDVAVVWGAGWGLRWGVGYGRG